MERIIAEFRKPLIEEWARKKIPPHIVSRYQKARKLQPDHTEQIFLRTGFKAWLAYFLTAKLPVKHFGGKAALTRAIADVDVLSVEEREIIATGLLNTHAHSTVESRLAELLSRCESGKSHRYAR